MKTSFVLVDFENVQPKNMGLLKGGPFKIKVFVGASQAKVSLEMAQTLQAFGDDAQYIQIAGNGSNALDFHIAYYIGRLAAEHPGAAFHIISKDTGFDPLIKHLKTQDIQCKRSASIADIVPGKPAAAPPAAKAERGSAAMEKKPPAKPAAKPRKVTAKVDPDQLKTVLENLGKRKSALPRSLKTLGSTIQSLFKPALGDVQLQAILDALAEQGKIAIAEKKVSYRLD